MNVKSIVTVVLLAFVAASVALVAIQELPSRSVGESDVGQADYSIRSPGAPTATDAMSARPDTQTDHNLIAYYFHRTQRCRTCLTIEAYSEETLKDAFAAALATGALEWRTVNVEEAANEHFVQDYQLASGALVLVKTRGGEREDWHNLDRVWELVGDELKFKVYVEAEVTAFMEQDS